MSALGRRFEMLLRFDPFREIDRLTNGVGTRVWQSGVPMDAYRQGDEFHVEMDLPGVHPDAIDLTVEKNVLTVKAERRWVPAEGVEVVVNERPQGELVRRLFLGESLDTERIQADYEAGVLRLTIPVAERSKARRVEVNTGGSTPSGVAIDTGSSEVPSGQQAKVHSAA